MTDGKHSKRKMFPFSRIKGTMAAMAAAANGFIIQRYTQSVFQVKNILNNGARKSFCGKSVSSVVLRRWNTICVTSLNGSTQIPYAHTPLWRYTKWEQIRNPCLKNTFHSQMVLRNVFNACECVFVWLSDAENIFQSMFRTMFRPSKCAEISLKFNISD